MQESARSRNKFGRHPYISDMSVKEGLRRLLYADPEEPLAPNPLWQLTLIDQMLLDPALPRVEKVRHRLLCHILVDSIEWGAAAVRKRCSAAPVSIEWTRADMLAELAKIAALDNMELKAWTALYARYVLIGAGIEPRDIAHALGLEARQNRRLHAYGVKLLTKLLVEREWAARSQSVRFRLLSRIPIRPVVRIIGRDTWLGSAQRLMDEDGQKLLITGDAGLGKKTLVRELLTRMIDGGQVDQLLWLTRPASVDAIMLWIQEALCTEPVKRFVLEHYLQMFRFVLVIDDLTDLEDSLHDLNRLLGQVGQAKVILVHHRLVTLGQISARLSVRPLETVRLNELFDIWWGRFHDGFGLPSMERAALVERSGGSPALLKQLIQDYGDRASEEVAAHPGYAGAFSDLSEDAQRGLVAILLSPDSQTAVQLRDMWGQYVDSALFQSLFMISALEAEAESDILRLTSDWRAWLIGDLAAGGITLQRVPELLAFVEAGLRTGRRTSAEVVESLLSADWLPISMQRRSAWLGMGWRSAVSGGRWAAWLERLRHATEEEFTDDPLLWLGRAVCAHKGSQWQECFQCLQRAIELAGENGLFGLQTEAMLERSIFLRLHGHFARAADELMTVQRAAKQYRLAGIVERAKIEQAQLALDREDPDSALSALETAESVPYALLLKAEAQCLKGDIAAARDYITMFESVPQMDLAMTARLHTLRASLHRQAGEHDLFRRECECAVMALEQADDQYSLARAYNNLGTAILEAGGSRHEALALYRRAEELQRVIGDAVALFASRHNITIASLP